MSDLVIQLNDFFTGEAFEKFSVPEYEQSPLQSGQWNIDIRLVIVDRLITKPCGLHSLSNSYLFLHDFFMPWL